MIVALTLLAVTVAVVVVTVDWRLRRRYGRELQMGKALGKNVGMTVTELERMFQPKTTYDHGRLTKFEFAFPAHLVGELADSERRAAVEAKLRATIRGLMGHVQVEWDHPRPRRPSGTVTLTRAEVPKPVPMFVDAADLR